MEDRRIESWHFHVAVPISLIAGFVLQTITLVWCASHWVTQLDNTTERVTHLEAWQVKQDDQISLFIQRQARSDQTLEDLAGTVKHIDNILEKYTRK